MTSKTVYFRAHTKLRNCKGCSYLDNTKYPFPTNREEFISELGKMNQVQIADKYNVPLSIVERWKNIIMEGVY